MPQPSTGSTGSIARASIGIALVIAAVAIVTLAFSAERREREERDSADHTTGTVVGVVKRQKGEAPLVRFATPSGEKVDFTATDAGATRYRVGDEVPVFYDPDVPSHARVDTGRSRWTRVATLGGFALVLAILGVQLTWSSRLTGR